MSVEDICRSLDLPDAKVALGSVEFDEMPDEDTMQTFCERLREVGFEPIQSHDLVILEKVKALIRHYARSTEAQALKLSTYIEDNIPLDFRYISRLFSSLEGRTIQRYLMLQRIEYVKELLLNDEMNLAEIADATGFSSVAHLSTAFKKNVGVTLSEFKTEGSRKGLDEV